MGWFKSTPSPSVEQKDTATTQPPLTKDESKESTLTQEATPSTPTTQTNTHTQTQEQTQEQAHTSLPEEYLTFDEYKEPEDPFERFKVSDAMNQLAACSCANIRNYYRYGTYRNCADKYDHMKFCLSIKTKSSQVAQVMIQKRDAEIRAKKSALPNSEDVWSARTNKGGE
ncbi:hypothetical protein BGZ49_001733 [Haplosporangium sp. Z 27]|nr:hypothetical protein BGZ49_001733 [Haplosporangium sp. Z 27]